VSTPVAAVPEMVADGVTGYIVPERDPVTLADRLSRLLDDLELAKKLGDAGHQRCLDLFALERTSASLCQILKDHDAIADFPGGQAVIERTAA